MFDNILGELRKLDRKQGGISIPIQMPLDDDGYFDRRCPSTACQSGFKVLFEDWQNTLSDVRAIACVGKTVRENECMCSSLRATLIS